MQLKMYALCGSAVALWLTPLMVLNEKVTWHKAAQGLTLTTAIACAVGAGNLAKKLTDESEIEAMKARAIKADVEDEISTEVYVSQQQRQREAELVLTSLDPEVEVKREALEAIYSDDLRTSTSTSEDSDHLVYLEVCKSMEAGKSSTWIVETILKMGGRKFADGKVKLENLLKRFGETKPERDNKDWLDF